MLAAAVIDPCGLQQEAVGRVKQGRQKVDIGQPVGEIGIGQRRQTG